MDGDFIRAGIIDAAKIDTGSLKSDYISLQTSNSVSAFTLKLEDLAEGYLGAGSVAGESYAVEGAFLTSRNMGAQLALGIKSTSTTSQASNGYYDTGTLWAYGDLVLGSGYRPVNGLYYPYYHFVPKYYGNVMIAKTLYTNSTTESSAGDITITGLSNYDLILIVVAFSSSYDYRSSALIPYEASKVAQVSVVGSNGSTVAVAFRQFTLNANKITLGTGFYATGSGQATDTKYAVLKNVVGLKYT